MEENTTTTNGHSSVIKWLFVANIHESLYAYFICDKDQDIYNTYLNSNEYMIFNKDDNNVDVRKQPLSIQPNTSFIFLIENTLYKQIVANRLPNHDLQHKINNLSTLKYLFSQLEVFLQTRHAAGAVSTSLNILLLDPMSLLVYLLTYVLEYSFPSPKFQLIMTFFWLMKSNNICSFILSNKIFIALVLQWVEMICCCPKYENIKKAYPLEKIGEFTSNYLQNPESLSINRLWNERGTSNSSSATNIQFKSSNEFSMEFSFVSALIVLNVEWNKFYKLLMDDLTSKQKIKEEENQKSKSKKYKTNNTGTIIDESKQEPPTNHLLIEMDFYRELLCLNLDKLNAQREIFRRASLIYLVRFFKQTSTIMGNAFNNLENLNSYIIKHCLFMPKWHQKQNYSMLLTFINKDLIIQKNTWVPQTFLLFQDKYMNTQISRFWSNLLLNRSLFNAYFAFYCFCSRYVQTNNPHKTKTNEKLEHIFQITKQGQLIYEYQYKNPYKPIIVSKSENNLKLKNNHETTILNDSSINPYKTKKKSSQYMNNDIDKYLIQLETTTKKDEKLNNNDQAPSNLYCRELEDIILPLSKINKQSFLQFLKLQIKYALLSTTIKLDYHWPITAIENIKGVYDSTQKQLSGILKSTKWTSLIEYDCKTENIAIPSSFISLDEIKFQSESLLVHDWKYEFEMNLDTKNDLICNNKNKNDIIYKLIAELNQLPPIHKSNNNNNVLESVLKINWSRFSKKIQQFIKSKQNNTDDMGVSSFENILQIVDLLSFSIDLILKKYSSRISFEQKNIELKQHNNESEDPIIQVYIFCLNSQLIVEFIDGKKIVLELDQLFKLNINYMLNYNNYFIKWLLNKKLGDLKKEEIVLILRCEAIELNEVYYLDCFPIDYRLTILWCLIYCFNGIHDNLKQMISYINDQIYLDVNDNPHFQFNTSKSSVIIDSFRNKCEQDILEQFKLDVKKILIPSNIIKDTKCTFKYFNLPVPTMARTAAVAVNNKKSTNNNNNNNNNNQEGWKGPSLSNQEGWKGSSPSNISNFRNLLGINPTESPTITTTNTTTINHPILKQSNAITHLNIEKWMCFSLNHIEYSFNIILLLLQDSTMLSYLMNAFLTGCIQLSLKTDFLQQNKSLPFEISPKFVTDYENGLLILSILIKLKWLEFIDAYDTKNDNLYIAYDSNESHTDKSILQDKIKLYSCYVYNKQVRMIHLIEFIAQLNFKLFRNSLIMKQDYDSSDDESKDNDIKEIAKYNNNVKLKNHLLNRINEGTSPLSTPACGATPSYSLFGMLLHECQVDGLQIFFSKATLYLLLRIEYIYYTCNNYTELTNKQNAGFTAEYEINIWNLSDLMHPTNPEVSIIASKILLQLCCIISYYFINFIPMIDSTKKLTLSWFYISDEQNVDKPLYQVICLLRELFFRTWQINDISIAYAGTAVPCNPANNNNEEGGWKGHSPSPTILRLKSEDYWHVFKDKIVTSPSVNVAFILSLQQQLITLLEHPALNASKWIILIGLVHQLKEWNSLDVFINLLITVFEKSKRNFKNKCIENIYLLLLHEIILFVSKELNEWWINTQPWVIPNAWKYLNDTEITSIWKTDCNNEEGYGVLPVLGVICNMDQYLSKIFKKPQTTLVLEYNEIIMNSYMPIMATHAIFKPLRIYIYLFSAHLMQYIYFYKYPHDNFFTSIKSPLTKTDLYFCDMVVLSFEQYQKELVDVAIHVNDDSNSSNSNDINELKHVSIWQKIYWNRLFIGSHVLEDCMQNNMKIYLIHRQYIILNVNQDIIENFSMINCSNFKIRFIKSFMIQNSLNINDTWNVYTRNLTVFRDPIHNNESKQQQQQQSSDDDNDEKNINSNNNNIGGSEGHSPSKDIAIDLIHFWFPDHSNHETWYTSTTEYEDWYNKQIKEKLDPTDESEALLKELCQKVYETNNINHLDTEWNFHIFFMRLWRTKSYHRCLRKFLQSGLVVLDPDRFYQWYIQCNTYIIGYHNYIKFKQNNDNSKKKKRRFAEDNEIYSSESDNDQDVEDTMIELDFEQKLELEQEAKNQRHLSFSQSSDNNNIESDVDMVPIKDRYTSLISKPIMQKLKAMWCKSEHGEIIKNLKNDDNNNDSTKTKKRKGRPTKLSSSKKSIVDDDDHKGSNLSSPSINGIRDPDDSDDDNDAPINKVKSKEKDKTKTNSIDQGGLKGHSPSRLSNHPSYFKLDLKHSDLNLKTIALWFFNLWFTDDKTELMDIAQDPILQPLQISTMPNLDKKIKSYADLNMSYKLLLKKQYEQSSPLDERGPWWFFCKPGPELIRMLYHFSSTHQWPDDKLFFREVNKEDDNIFDCLYKTNSKQTSYFPEYYWDNNIKSIPNGNECAAIIYSNENNVDKTFNRLKDVTINRHVTLINLTKTSFETRNKGCIDYYQIKYIKSRTTELEVSKNLSIYDVSSELKRIWKLKFSNKQKLLLISKKHINLIDSCFEDIQHIYMNYNDQIVTLDNVKSLISKKKNTYIYTLE